MDDVLDPIRKGANTHHQTARSDELPALERLRAQMERATQDQGLNESAKQPQALEAAAITRLTPEMHPVRRYWAEMNSSAISQKNAKHRVSRCLRLLTNREERPTDEEIFTFPWHVLTVDDIEQFELALSQSHYKAATRNAARMTLRGIIRQCRRTKLIDRSQEDALLEVFKRDHVDGEPAGRAIEFEEYTQFFRACVSKNVWRTARDQAILALFASTGVRSHEMRCMTLQDVDLKSGWILLPVTKNGRSHRVPISSVARDYLTKWLSQRGARPGFLFFGKPGQEDRALGDRFFQNFIERLCVRAGLPHTTPHDFRRTVATELLRTHDPVTVMRLLNHSSLNSTIRYDRAPQEEQAKAVDSLPIPSLRESDDEVAS